MQKRLVLISFLAAMLLPLSAFADTGHAGFPQASIWLSNTAPLSGQQATVYAVVYNSTDSKLESTLTFAVDAKTLSTMAVSLAPGASQIYSTQWIAAEGTHAFSASLSGTTVSDVIKDTGTVSITVAPPPAPSASQQAVAQTTNVINSVASTSLPMLSSVTQAIYTEAENLRQQGLDLVQQTSGIVATDADEGTVLGTSTLRIPASASSSSKKPATGIMATFYSILILIFESRAIFYPVVLVLILLILWLLMRWVNKPRF